jgi:hypothetical protein
MAQSNTPLSYLESFAVDIIRRFPRSSFLGDENEYMVRLEATFRDEVAAERFEDKVRKLLENDNMEVLYSTPGPKPKEKEDGPSGPPYLP